MLIRHLTPHSSYIFVYWLSTHPMWRFYIGAENVITGKKSSDGRPYLVTRNYVCAVAPIPFTVRKIRTGYLHHQGNRAGRKMTEFYEMFRRKRRGTALLSAESSLRALSAGNFVTSYLQRLCLGWLLAVGHGSGIRVHSLQVATKTNLLAELKHQAPN